MSLFSGLIRREWWLLRQRGAAWAQPLVLFAIIVTAFVLAAEAGADWLPQAAPAIVWTALLLALMVGQERAFRDDVANGFMQQLCRAPAPLPVLMLGRMLSNWLFVAVPLLLAAPLALMALAVPQTVLGPTLLALLVGSPALSLLVSVGAMLTAGLPRAGLLLPLCILPLCLPVMIFGAGAARLAESGAGTSGPLYFLGFVSALCLCGLPFVTAAAARLQP